jgi:hypothetical protein
MYGIEPRAFPRTKTLLAHATGRGVQATIIYRNTRMENN